MATLFLCGCIITAQPRSAAVEVCIGETREFWVVEFPPGERIWHLDGRETPQADGVFGYTPRVQDQGTHTLELSIVTFGWVSASHRWTITVPPELPQGGTPLTQIDEIRVLLGTGADLDFLAKLTPSELERLTILLRARLLEKGR